MRRSRCRSVSRTLFPTTSFLARNWHLSSNPTTQELTSKVHVNDEKASQRLEVLTFSWGRYGFCI
jgi:hypothetical protein